MALTLSTQTSRLLCPASAAHDTLAAFTVGLWFRGATLTNGARHWNKSSTLRLNSQGTTGDLRSVMDAVEAPPDILNATSSGNPAPGGTTWRCLIVEQSLADGVRIYVGTETTLPAEVTYADRTTGDPLLTAADDSASQFRFGGTGTGATQTQAGDYSYCMRLNRVATAQEREDWWRTLALPTDGSVLGDWRPGENGLIDVPDHGPLNLDLVLSGTITVTGADPTLPGPAGGTGTATLGLLFGLLATAVAPVTASATLALALSLGATAVAPVAATASLPLSLGIQATGGAPGVSGAAALPLTFGLTATGAAPIAAAGSLPFVLGVSGSAVIPVTSTGSSLDLALGLSAQGVAPVRASGVLALSLGVSASAAAPAQASITLPLTLGLQATGVGAVVVTGTADLPLTLGVTAAGMAPVTADGLLPLTLSLSGTAQVPVSAVASMGFALSTTGTAAVRVTGLATLPFSMTFTVAGSGPFTGPDSIVVAAVTIRTPTADNVAMRLPTATSVAVHLPRTTAVTITP